MPNIPFSARKSGSGQVNADDGTSENATSTKNAGVAESRAASPTLPSEDTSRKCAAGSSSSTKKLARPSAISHPAAEGTSQSHQNRDEAEKVSEDAAKGKRWKSNRRTRRQPFLPSWHREQRTDRPPLTWHGAADAPSVPRRRARRQRKHQGLPPEGALLRGRLGAGGDEGESLRLRWGCGCLPPPPPPSEPLAVEPGAKSICEDTENCQHRLCAGAAQEHRRRYLAVELGTY